MNDLYHVILGCAAVVALGLVAMGAFCVVAPMYGIQL